VLVLVHEQLLCVHLQAARLGIVTGMHLAQVARANYARPAAYLLSAMAEIAIIGSDIQEVSHVHNLFLHTKVLYMRYRHALLCAVLERVVVHT
jgi:Mn2+/Fe2+ NRAMP family transporter